MRKLKRVMVLLAIVLLAASCKQKISFTRDVQKKYNLTEAELGKLQYYLVNDIVLYSASRDGNTSLEDGEIVINEEESVNKVIFKSGTRGILHKVEGTDKIAVRFENGEGKFLTFGSTTMKGRYTLQAKSWKPNGRGVIEYGGEDYLTSKSSASAYISVKLKKNKDYSNSQRVVKGKKLK